MAWEKKPFWHNVVLVVEKGVKVPLFKCHTCGNCILRFTAFTCPMRCPKQLRNGPCGGAENGRCEVDRNMDCVWNLIYSRAKLLGRMEQLQRIQPPVDWSLYGTSSWINHFTGKDAFLFQKEEGGPAAG